MKKEIIFCISGLLLFSHFSFSMEVVKIGNREIAMEGYRKKSQEKHEQIIEKRCLVVNCEATQILKKGIQLNGSEMIQFGRELSGGRNPGSVLCSKFLKGVVLFGVKKNGSTQTYCQMRDRSLISTHAIHLADDIR